MKDPSKPPNLLKFNQTLTTEVECQKTQILFGMAYMVTWVVLEDIDSPENTTALVIWSEKTYLHFTDKHCGCVNNYCCI